MDTQSLSITNVLGPSQSDRTRLIPLRINALRVKTVAERGQINRLFEMFYNVAGVRPPVNNIGYFERGSAFPDNWGGPRHAHALFAGIKRPFNDVDEDDKVSVYVLSPRYVYRYQPGMVCVAKRESAPNNAVFVVYVKFDHDDRSGEILNWEWVTESPDSPGLPDGFEARYKQRLW